MRLLQFGQYGESIKSKPTIPYVVQIFGRVKNGQHSSATEQLIEERHTYGK